MRITEQPSSTQITRASFRQLLTSPAIWIPAVSGGLAILTAATTGAITGTIGLVGLGLVVAAGGVAAYQWLVGRKKLERRALISVLREAEQQELDRLKSLRQEMRQDRDPHSTQLVRQLRDSFQRIVAMVMEESTRTTRWTPLRENLDTSTALYESCQRLLERSVKIWLAARAAGTDSTKDDLLGQRNEVLRQVEQSIENLNASLDQMQAERLRDDDSVESNQRLRDELQMGLETARRVEERMDAFERDIKYRERI